MTVEISFVTFHNAIFLFFCQNLMLSFDWYERKKTYSNVIESWTQV